ncbi:MAG: hypothetical protein EYC69_10810 [Bacteroidetes bacterium]|nr:MAG: hypothetical protein EYC69_10810 [Bacteroidota bacterium]
MYKILVLFFLSFSWTFSGCASEWNNTTTSKAGGYDLNKPIQTFILPDTLHEVSGLTDIDKTTFACIQDENGILFIYDFSKNEIQKQYSFHIDGDYEGITRVGSTMYILRSDGVIFEILNFESANFSIVSYNTGIPANNNEGLCYDPDNSRLLIAAKGKVGKGKEFKDKRVIYGFDLNTKKLTTDPVFDFDLQAIREFALTRKFEFPTKSNKKGVVKDPNIKFMTSAIAIHPVSKKLYLLSAADHLFFIFGSDGTLEHMELLNPEIFNKAEGITFLDNHDMLITNEGQNRRPTLLRFSYQAN